MSAIAEALVAQKEEQSPDGLTSSEILGFFSENGVSFSEATLRKYVQLGLLPRSVRVGQKGKHRGSKGVYPVRVLRQILLIKEMLKNSYTIEQIQRQALFVRVEIDDLERSLETVLDKLKRALTKEGSATLSVSRELSSARGVMKDLLLRLRTLEGRLVERGAVDDQEAMGAVS